MPGLQCHQFVVLRSRGPAATVDIRNTRDGAAGWAGLSAQV